MSSSPELLQSKQIDEQNSTSEREALSEKGKEDAMKPLGYLDFTAAAETVQVICRGVLIFGALVALVTIEAILSTEGAFSSDIQPTDHHLLAAFRGSFTGVLVFIIIILVQSVANVMCYRQGSCSWTLRLCTGVALIRLTRAFAIRSSRSLTSSIWFSAFVVTVLLCIGLQGMAFLCKKRHSQETLEKCSKHWDTAETEDHWDPALSDPQQTAEADQLLQTFRVNLLLLLGILAVASIPYQTGLQPPVGFWHPSATNGLHHYHARAGYTIIPQTTYPRMYPAIFFFNTTAFAASDVIVNLHLTNVSKTQRTKYLQAAMVSDLHVPYRVYAAGNCRSVRSSLNYLQSKLVAKWNRSVRSSLNYLQSKLVAKWNSTIEREALSENNKEDATKALIYQANKYEASTVAIDTYVKFWCENVGAHLAGYRVLCVTYLRRYRAFFYCLATVFTAYIFMVSSLRVKWFNDLRWSLYVVCMMGAYGVVDTGRNLATSALRAPDPETLKALCWRLVTLVTVFGAVTYHYGLTTMYSMVLVASPVILMLPMTRTLTCHGYGCCLWVFHSAAFAIWSSRYLMSLRAPAFSASVISTGLFTSVVILILVLSNKCSTQRYSAIYQACMFYESQEALTGQGAFGQVYAAGICSESVDPAVDDEDDRANRPTKHSPREATWRVACAAPHHMTGNRSLLLTSGYMPVLHNDDGDNNDGEVVLVNLAATGEAVPLRVRGSGSVRTESIALDDVWYVPGLDSNLVSTGQLARQGCAVSLGPDGCRITRDGGALVGTARFTEECQFELDFLKVAA